MKGKKIFLRGHHLVCLMLFEGRGYDEKHVENINKILNYLKSNNKEKFVEIVYGVDDVCSCCPKVKDLNFCALSKEVKLCDALWLKRFGLEVGANLSFDEIIEKYDCLANDESFKHICHGCSWFSFCCSIRSRRKQTTN